MSATLTKAEIAARVPHAGPMCLLERVLAWDANQIVCEAINHRNTIHPLADKGRLDATAAIEYAAQAMAVHGGLLAGTDESPKAGYLASVRDVVIAVPTLNQLQDDLLIKATRLMGDESRVLYEFHVSAGAKLCASGRAAVVMNVGKL